MEEYENERVEDRGEVGGEGNDGDGGVRGDRLGDDVVEAWR